MSQSHKSDIENLTDEEYKALGKKIGKLEKQIKQSFAEMQAREKQFKDDSERLKLNQVQIECLKTVEASITSTKAAYIKAKRRP